MLITALVLTLVGVLRRSLRGRAPDEARSTERMPVRQRVERVASATRRAATRVVREPLPALSAAVAGLGLAVVGTHLACSGTA
ncbi:hypothetical protein ACFWM1_21000 [Nocardia sp. NPDC058379]|uniref:hypothetical protein n=1 Tax=unclassified Nocardia TaxID=2637762 RepID=UPI003666353A